MLRNYVCPISHEVILEAVRTPAGHLYERKSIEQWIDENGTDPQTRDLLSIEDLEPAQEDQALILKTLNKLVEDEVELNGLHPTITAGLKAFHKGLKEKIEESFAREVIELKKRSGEMKISHSQFAVDMVAITKKYYEI